MIDKINFDFTGIDEGCIFNYSATRSFKTCIFCGTIYDLHGVDIDDYLLPIGDGCEYCDPEFPGELDDS